MKKTHRAIVASALLPAFLLGRSAAASGQQSSRGTALSAGGGALLGVYSGTALGLTGGLLPCDRTALGPGCPLVTAIAGGTLGLVAGG
jgi:hypothetical protein